MARGFESKSVADQQETAREARPKKGDATPDPMVLQKRRRLELGRADVLRHMESATAEGHRQMLKRALDALDRELASLR
jgi:hypothetical protein